VQLLKQRGLLEKRGPGRRKSSVRRVSKQPFTVGLLMPVSTTAYAWTWQSAVLASASRRGIVVREVVCRHWTDTMVSESLKGFDGVFALQFPPELPGHTRQILTASGTPMISLDQDLTGCGIPSLLAFPPACSTVLLDHFYRLGHRRISCLNTFPLVADIPQRIAQWNDWMGEKGLEAHVIGRPPPSFLGTEVYFRRAHKLVYEMARKKKLPATAFFCPTVWSALGAMRALQEAGLRVGRDVSVGAVNDEGMAELVYPALTSVRMPDLGPQLGRCLDWMLAGGKRQGDLRLRPPRTCFFEGGSSGRVVRSGR